MVGGLYPLNNLANFFQISHVQTHERGGMEGVASKISPKSQISSSTLLEVLLVPQHLSSS